MEHCIDPFGITDVVIPLKSVLGGLPIIGDVVQDFQFLGSFPYYDAAASTTQNAAAAWSQFDVFSSLPYWN